jgi:hypothetical protein
MGKIDAKRTLIGVSGLIKIPAGLFDLRALAGSWWRERCGRLPQVAVPRYAVCDAGGVCHQRRSNDGGLAIVEAGRAQADVVAEHVVEDDEVEQGSVSEASDLIGVQCPDLDPHCGLMPQEADEVVVISELWPVEDEDSSDLHPVPDGLVLGVQVLPA